MNKIARDLNLPRKGRTPNRLHNLIVERVKDQQFHLLIVLDSLDRFIVKDRNNIYSFLETNDDSLKNGQYVSIVGIARDMGCLDGLDSKIKNKLQRNIIHFKKYNKEQRIDIAKYQARNVQLFRSYRVALHSVVLLTWSLINLFLTIYYLF